MTLQFSLAHTAQPIHKDTLVPGHVMPYTYIAAAYTQSPCQLATSITLLKHVTWNDDLAAFPEVAMVAAEFEPLATQECLSLYTDDSELNILFLIKCTLSIPDNQSMQHQYSVADKAGKFQF